ncbi:MAG: hypothetical protein MUF81_20665, partial [Verrucomicrobia bacterium]|nr:hypothetical protein [Verrucomicrobiota bacterium]
PARDRTHAFGSVTNTAVLSFLDLKMYAGLTVAGPVGSSYRIDYIPALAGTNTWQWMTDLTLPASPYIWFDLDSPYQPKRFYRAVLLP